MNENLVENYDRVAQQYAERLGDELDQKPFDRLMLDRFGELVGDGVVGDVGCGPGHVGRYLQDAGATGVFGIDQSPGMVAVARTRNPGMRFEVGDMNALAAEDAAWDGAVGFYSLVHVRTHMLGRPFLELARVVREGGWLLLAFHVGSKIEHLDEWWGHEVDIDFVFHHRMAVTALLRETGWRVVDAMERPPYGEDVEYPSHRAYLIARRVG